MTVRGARDGAGGAAAPKITQNQKESLMKDLLMEVDESCLVQCGLPVFNIQGKFQNDKKEKSIDGKSF